MRFLLCLVGLCLAITTECLKLPSTKREQDKYHARSSNGNPAAPIAGEDMAYWKQDAQERLQRQIEQTERVAQAKNVIFFLGDGMSLSTVTAARIMKGSLTGKWERETLSWEEFPHVSLSKHYTTDYQVADSACSATAYLTGTKANKGTIGVDANVLRGDCAGQLETSYHSTSIAKWFQDAGKSTGIVTTTRVTHATPSGTYAHIAERDWEDDYEVQKDGADPEACDDIAEQLIMKEPGNKFKVIMGGGRRHFYNSDHPDVEDGSQGYRSDGKDLVSTWEQDKADQGASASYVWNRDDLMAVDIANTDYLMGLFSDSHLDYAVDRDVTMDPSLSEMTKIAIEMLQKDDNGFFLLVEGGRIDHAHHSNKAKKSLVETLELDKAVQVALNMTNQDETIILVTADHAHSLNVNGYPARHNDILGFAEDSADDDLPFTTLMYGQGPGFEITEDCKRPDPAQADYTGNEYRQTSAAPLDSSNHDGTDVGIWVIGPHSHLFSGVYEQNYIPHALAYAACVGEGITFCDTNH